MKKETEKKETEKIVVTHNGTFHADEVFAVATLNLVLTKVKVIRSRDDDVIKSGDYVVDVGHVYDENKNKFDHHQTEGAGQRENGIPYASFGLVWKHFAKKLTKSNRVLEKIDEILIQPIDAIDNGVSISDANDLGIRPYKMDDLINSLNPTWEESRDLEDVLFLEAVEIAKKTITRLLLKIKAEIKAEKFVVSSYKKAKDKRIVILDGIYSWKNAIRQFEEPLFVIFPGYGKDKWVAHAIKDDEESFQSRKLFPKNWGGRQGRDLARETGVQSATFCHRGLFICTAEDKEGAIELAQKALESL